MRGGCESCEGEQGVRSGEPGLMQAQEKGAPEGQEGTDEHAPYVTVRGCPRP